MTNQYENDWGGGYDNLKTVIRIFDLNEIVAESRTCLHERLLNRAPDLLHKWKCTPNGYLLMQITGVTYLWDLNDGNFAIVEKNIKDFELKEHNNVLLISGDEEMSDYEVTLERQNLTFQPPSTEEEIGTVELRYKEKKKDKYRLPSRLDVMYYTSFPHSNKITYCNRDKPLIMSIQDRRTPEHQIDLDCRDLSGVWPEEWPEDCFISQLTVLKTSRILVVFYSPSLLKEVNVIL